MTIPLRYATAGQEIPLGYFLDSTDGDTEETGLTIANTDIKLWKHGHTTLTDKNSGGATHISNGVYYCVLDATDSNTKGGLVVFVHKAGALSVKVNCFVYSENIYDTMCSTDVLKCDLWQIGGVEQSATDLKDFADEGYDPATNKVQGVVLTDTCTTNTDVRGTDSAALADTALTNATWTDARAGALTDWINGGRLDLILDIIAADTTTDIPAKLLAYMQLLARSDAAIATDNATELTAINADGGSGAGDFSNQAEALEAIRDRGDAAWTGGGVAPTVGEIRTEMEGAGTKLTLTLGDTDELQGNQGAWATAVGFSTHSAADIWSVGTRALTDKSGFALSTAGINAIWDDLISGITQVGSIGKLIADNLNATITSRAPAGEYNTQMGYIPSNLGDVPIASELNSAHGAGSWATATGFSTHNAAAIWSVATRILTANTNFNDLDAAAIKAEVAAALQDIKLDHLINIAVDTDWDTTVHLDSVIGHMADVGTAATFNRTQESLEAIRNRGDAAWTTGGGGAINDILNIQPLIPFSVDLADTATVRIGLGLTNMVDDLPTTGEITPGTITIDRKAIGGTSWVNKVNAAACSELAGLIYYDEVFDTGAGYVAGDSIRVTFKSQKITVDANDFEITGTDGWVFQTYIREAMVGTAGAYTGTPPTVIEIRQEMDANSTKMAPSQTLNDYKATGFSTHSAASVWAVGTRALTDKAGFALSTAGIKAIWDQLTAALTTVGSIGKLLVDNINATISSRNSTTPPTVGAIRTEMEGAGTKLTEILEDTGTTLDEMIERILGLEQENLFIDNTTYTGVHLTSARIRIYSVAGSVGTASDVIATYTMTASYTGDEMDDYKVVKV